MNFAGSTDVLDTYDRICALVGADHRGITLKALATAHALARELESEAPDASLVRQLCERLGIEREALR